MTKIYHHSYFLSIQISGIKYNLYCSATVISSIPTTLLFSPHFSAVLCSMQDLSSLTTV